MTSKKTLLAIPLIAIAVIAIGFGMTSNVFAQPDNQKDGETADDHNSATEGPNGDGDGEQKDSTESGK